MASGAVSPSPSLSANGAKAGDTGVNDSTARILAASELVNRLMNNGVTNFKIYDDDHTLLSAFANSGISVVLILSNQYISSAADNQLFTDEWVNTNILPYYPATNITIIAVGVEVIQQRPDLLTSDLLGAIHNLHTFLQKLNLDGSIKVSTPFTPDVLSNWYPPSKAKFKPHLIAPVMKPLVDFLQETNSYFIIDFDKSAIDQSSAAEGIISDPFTGQDYADLLDAQIDAFYSAILSISTRESRISPSRDYHQVRVTATRWGKRVNAKPRATAMNTMEVKPRGIAAAEGSIATKDSKVNEGGNTPSGLDEELEVYIDVFSFLTD